MPHESGGGMTRCASIGIALLALTPLACANVSSALAQAGSIGGTIGKQDKSISGDQSPSEPNTPPKSGVRRLPAQRDTTERVGRSKRGARRNTAQPGSEGPSCGHIAGTWSWPNGSTMAFGKDGSAGTAGQPPSGTWRCSGSKIIAVFNNGGRDQYVVAPDGESLTFTTNWLPGTYTAKRRN